jgi:TfoX/Sxy family transcriptional regulator of competence genes
MAKPYLEKLSKLIQQLNIENEISQPIEARHFFSGAALYANGTFCASWSPAGLAFKLPAVEVERLIASGKAIPLKYFPKGHIKKGYALFENPDDSRPGRWKEYFLAAAQEL